MDVKEACKNDKKTILTEGTIIPDFTVDGEINMSAILETKQEVLCIKYTPDLELLAGGFTDGYVRIFKPEKGQCVNSLIDEEILNNPVPVSCIKHRNVQKNKPVPNSIICTYVNGCVKCWNHTSRECVYTIHENRQTLGLAYCPKMSKFVTVGDDGRVILYDEESRCQEKSYKSSESPDALDGHLSRVYSACFNPKSPHEFLTGGWDDTVLYWDMRKPAPVRHLSGVHICGDGIDICKTGKEILTCAWQKSKQLMVWDYTTGEALADIHADVHEPLLYCGKWVTKDLIAAGGSDPNLIRIVDRNQKYTVALIQGFSSNGVYSTDLGPMRPRRSLAKKQNMKYVTEPLELPKIAFCAGRRIYEFYFK